MKKSLVCVCNEVTEREILVALKKGARSVFDIRKITGAGCNCGRCSVVVNAIVAEFLKNLPSEPQQKIIFGD